WPGTLEMASLVGGLGVALAGGDASLVYLGAGAGSNAAENNMVGQITMLAQNVARFNQAGWQGLSAAGQAAILRCAASNWCASLPLMAAAVGYVNSTQFAANQPSLADQIPTGYGAGGVRVLDGSTSTSADVVQGPNSTITPGTALSNPGTPGYGASNPNVGGTSTSIPNNGPMGGSVVMSAPGHPPFDPSRDPSVGNYRGSTPATVGLINDVLAGAFNTTTGTGVPNARQPPAISRQQDFDYLTQGARVIRPNPDVQIGILGDGTRVVSRPSTTGPMTIEIQRSDGRSIIEIRYESK
ncbi:hypothetical protein, partial [Variovorax sp. JS1663]|uniref:hypothetical protein n=1 Tax=Variovorax sp. JS1663 TaxID=1851577 RepID=UPI001EDFB72A